MTDSVSITGSSDDLRQAAVTIWRAGVEAVLGDVAVRNHVCVDQRQWSIGDGVVKPSDFDRVIVVGGGKASAAMARGWVEATRRGAADGSSSELPVSGWINVPEGTAIDLGEIKVFEARPAGMNEPTEKAVYGTEQILQAVVSAGPRDLCIVLLSGGGSALLCAPATGITLDDKLAVTRLLSAGGASIDQLNTVRKQLSRIKGGRLRLACRAGRMITMVLSDVIGDPLDVIASGPTVDDSSTPEDALAVLAEFDPDRRLPERVYRRLAEAKMNETRPARNDDTEHDVVVIGNNAAAVDAAGVCAEQLGFSHAMDASTGAEGTAEEVGGRLAEMAIEMLRAPATGRGGTDCLITGGEPVVKLAPPEIRGKGGRNQQLVLAAMVALSQHPEFRREDRGRLVLLSGGTDGEDGPTDAAGAILCRRVWQACESRGLDAADYLRRNDAYRFFEETDGLFVTGPTGTNVCDLRVLAVGRQQ